MTKPDRNACPPFPEEISEAQKNALFWLMMRIVRRSRTEREKSENSGKSNENDFDRLAKAMPGKVNRQYLYDHARGNRLVEPETREALEQLKSLYVGVYKLVCDLEIHRNLEFESMINQLYRGCFSFPKPITSSDPLRKLEGLDNHSNLEKLIGDYSVYRLGTYEERNRHGMIRSLLRIGWDSDDDRFLSADIFFSSGASRGRNYIRLKGPIYCFGDHVYIFGSGETHEVPTLRVIKAPQGVGNPLEYSGVGVHINTKKKLYGAKLLFQFLGNKTNTDVNSIVEFMTGKSTVRPHKDVMEKYMNYAIDEIKDVENGQVLSEQLIEAADFDENIYKNDFSELRRLIRGLQSSQNLHEKPLEINEHIDDIINLINALEISVLQERKPILIQ